MKQRLVRHEHAVELTKEHYKRAALGQRYWDVEVLDDSEESSLHLLSYIQNVRENVLAGVGLYLHGPNGTGKTFAAAAVLKAAMRHCFSALFLHSDDLRTVYLREDRNADESMLARLYAVDVLVLDDLGTEYSAKNRDWAQTCFENLLRRRFCEKKPMIITTNISPIERGNKFTPTVLSLMMQLCVDIRFSGVDQRLINRPKILVAQHAT